MSYSSGFKRRLDLARAMLREPPVYLLDEPTSSIDPHSALQIRQVIMDLKTRGHTVLLVTHNLGEAEKLCNRVGILDKGVFLAEGTMSQLRQLASGTRIRLQLTPPIQADCLSSFYKVEGIERIQMDAEEIFLFVRHRERALHSLLALIREQGWQLTELHMEEPTLEDVFFRLVGR
jgi:ABC-2 type transport system ATP-binding protein